MVAERIPLEDVQSSNLAAIGYNDVKQILAVQFRSGAIFHYAPVSEDLFRAFCQAPSLGTFYAKEIRGKVSGQKMTGTCPKCGAMGWIGETCTDCGCAVVLEDPPKAAKESAPGRVP